MDFNQLMARMRELDQPVGETQALECGEPMGMMPPNAPTREVPPPSLSVNLNAQGMDNIEQIMKLITKVNPDAAKPELPPLPTMGMEPSIMSIKPDVPKLPSLGNLDNGPLKMLPDMDADNDNKIGGEKDSGDEIDVKFGPGDEVSKAQGDLDNDGDHDMDDHDMEKDGEEDKEDEEDKEEAFGNSMAGSEPDVMNVDASIPDGNDLNKPKATFPKVAGGDNPMQKTESTDLRSQIRSELLRRLEEAKAK